MNFPFRIVACAIAAIWMAGLWYLPVALERPETATSIETSSELYSWKGTKANFGMLKARFYETVQDRSHWKILSEFAELHRREDYAFLTTVAAEFTSAKSGNVVKTTSQFGRTYLTRKDVELNGNVQIQSQQGYLFRMENLTYSGRSHQFQSADLVSMEGPDPLKPKMRLRGTGLIGNADSEHFILKKNVTGERRLGGSGAWMKITSLQGEFYTAESRSLFIGRVKAILPKMAVDCDKLRLVVADETEDIEARGNVKVTTRGRTAYADTAVLQVGGSQILLEGKARVDSKDNQIRGRRILLFTDEDRIEVDDAEGSSRS